MKDALDTNTGEFPLPDLSQLADRIEKAGYPLSSEAAQALRDAAADRALLHAIKTAMKDGDTLGLLQLKLDAALAARDAAELVNKDLTIEVEKLRHRYGWVT